MTHHIWQAVHHHSCTTLNAYSVPTSAGPHGPSFSLPIFLSLGKVFPYPQEQTQCHLLSEVGLCPLPQRTLKHSVTAEACFTSGSKDYQHTSILPKFSMLPYSFPLLLLRQTSSINRSTIPPKQNTDSESFQHSSVGRSDGSQFTTEC